MKKSFNIQKLLHGKSKRHGTKLMHPSSLRAFQSHQEHYLKHTNSVDLITTKQNKLPSFIDIDWMDRHTTRSHMSLIETLSLGYSFIIYPLQVVSYMIFFSII